MRLYHKGFTLIELIAVIIILGIISLITVPTIINLIDSSRMKAAELSADGIIKSGQQYYYISKYNGTKITNIIDLKTEDILKYSGGRPEGGTLIIDNYGNISSVMKFQNYCSIKRFVDTEVTTFKIDETNSCEMLASELALANTYKDINLNWADPQLESNMIPVIYDESKWVKADITEEWYNYDKKYWANAVTVTESSRSSYQSAVAGTEILESDILTYLVWIPRYRYRIWNDNLSINTTGVNNNKIHTIEVEFEHSKIDKSNGNTNETWLTHPAFTFGDKELNGFWVSKFEISSDETSLCYTAESVDNCNVTNIYPKVKPNRTSWRSIQLANAFQVVRNMESINNIYGFTAESVDTHVTKNMEWGAVAYLSHSKFGINKEIRMNNSKLAITGCAATNVPTAAYPDYSNYYEGCQNQYNTSAGFLASTTGNITGIYDISGGSVEFVMGILEDSPNSNKPMSGYNATTHSGFNGMLSNGGSVVNGIDFPDSKYYDIYNYGTTAGDVNAYSRGKLGDATMEMGPFGTYSGSDSIPRYINSWYGDLANFVHNNGPWFVRGSSWADGSITGAFGYSNFFGSADGRRSFRAIVSVE
ncbi:MAG: prepilin-type N-terminal cleavage/methylation domain-containing protein [Ignavibacteriales bacterium]